MRIKEEKQEMKIYTWSSKDSLGEAVSTRDFSCQDADISMNITITDNSEYMRYLFLPPVKLYCRKYTF